jgi:general secretion pathway protein A
VSRRLSGQRLINQVCDHALLLACAGGRQQVDRAAIEEAWADLQQLPTPWNADAADALNEKADAGIIEFGGLEDEPEQPERAAGRGESRGHERPSVPMLRISPGSDEPSDDPVDQLEQIEQTLSGLDDDFQPAGSIGPELELVFDDAEDPFAEQFAEEEPVVDRFQPRPETDADAESQPSAPPAADREAPPEAAETQAAPVADDREPAELPAAADAVEEDPRDDGAEQSRAAETVEPYADAESDPVPETVPLHPEEHRRTTEAAAALEPEDDEMIIVEEGYQETPPIHTHPAAAVRRLEYGRLFARLRRSC